MRRDRESVGVLWDGLSMKLVDWFDLGMDALPKKAARLLLVGLLLVSGGRFMTWYVEEKAASIQEVMQGVLDQMIEDLTPHEPATMTPPKPV